MIPAARIAVNAAVVGDRPTGLGAYALQLIRWLDRLGERQVVFTSRPDLLEAPHALRYPSPRGARPERGARGHLRRLLWVQTGLRAGVRRARPRALLNMTPEGLLASAVDQVTVLHDVLPLRFPAEYPRQQYYFRYYVPAVLRASRAVVVSSESTRRDVLELYRIAPERVHVVLPGVDLERFAPGDGPSALDAEPYALYVGNVMPHKNLLRLVDAFAAAARGTDWTLRLRGWGRPPHVAALEGRIASLGIGAHVDWQPYAAAETLPELYRRARMLLLPSLYEGFGLTALEAMACGTPVVTSRVSSLPEVVGDAGHLVDPLDTGDLARAISTLFADDGAAKELRARGLARAREFRWERAARAVQGLLHPEVNR